mmetsp:Transcript_7112/g.32106  ORF Transcript_7112/g.32106 Transcript_7112/m.32106 type:complete len:220 (-) Transcript_7112:1974-2633(-)
MNSRSGYHRATPFFRLVCLPSPRYPRRKARVAIRNTRKHSGPLGTCLDLPKIDVNCGSAANSLHPSHPCFIAALRTAMSCTPGVHHRGSSPVLMTGIGSPAMVPPFFSRHIRSVCVMSRRSRSRFAVMAVSKPKGAPPPRLLDPFSSWLPFTGVSAPSGSLPPSFLSPASSPSSSPSSSSFPSSSLSLSWPSSSSSSLPSSCSSSLPSAAGLLAAVFSP